MSLSTSYGDGLQELLAKQRADSGLQRALYNDEGVFSLERERIFKGRWLFVDHIGRIPNAGDYFVREILGESIIFLRSWENTVRAYYNVCRHRGSRLCTKGSGNARALVCPYHGWTYELNGRLRHARHMPAGFDPEDNGLVECETRVAEGLIFVRLGALETDDFDTMIEPFKELLEFHGIGAARICAQEVVPVKANWKLVIENNQECYHCQTGHPEFFETMSKEYVLAFGAGPESGTPDAAIAFGKRITSFEERARELGHPYGLCIDDPDSEYFRAVSRVPFREGFVSMTQDGTPAAPLMGKANGFDGGRTAMAFDPFTLMLASNDYAVTINMMPKSVDESETILTWFVAADSEDGVDCDPEKVKWLFDVTIRQDGVLAANNQLGVNSEVYRSGLYSTHEAAAVRFHEWYLSRMRYEVRPHLAKVS